jgi:hypothetical protein
MSEPQLPREVRRHPAIIRHVEEITGNVALTCRYYGISCQCYYIWYGATTPDLTGLTHSVPAAAASWSRTTSSPANRG